MTTLCQADWVETRAQRASRLAAGVPPGVFEPAPEPEPEPVPVPVPVPAFRYIPSADYPRRPVPFRGSCPSTIQEPSS